METVSSESENLEIVEKDGENNVELIESESRVAAADMEDEEEEDEFFIDWDDTLCLPEPHLITEESFNKHFSYEKYLTCISSINQNSKITIPQKAKNPEKTQKKKATTKEATAQNDIFDEFNRISSENRNDIFEDVPNYKPLSELQTKYHFSLRQQPKFSNIYIKDRRFHAWFLNNQLNGRKTFVELNQARFEDLSKEIAREQGEYQQFLRSCAMSQPNEYVYLSLNVRDFIMNEVSKSTKVLLQSTKSFFSLKKTIDISRPPVLIQVAVDLKFIKCTIPQTKIPTMTLPPLDAAMKTPMSNASASEGGTKVADAVASCEDVAAGFYIEATALLAIMESLIVPSREWLIPLSVEVKECAPGMEGADGNVVVIHKPYPRRNMNFREANCTYFRQVLHDILNTKDDNSHRQESTTSDEIDSSTCVNLFTCGTHKLLVESRIDCADHNTDEKYSMNAKTEYQPFIGFEQFSLKDLCEFWWRSKLSNTQILCARIDPRNNCTRRIDKYTRDVLCSPGCPYKPEFFFYHLSSLFDHLSCCPTGGYMLEHASGNNHFFLFEEKEKGFTTLETKYKDLLTGKRQLINEDLNVSQWIPIDTSVRPCHLPERKIPWLFELKPIPNIEFHALGKRKQPQKPRQMKKQNFNKNSSSGWHASKKGMHLSILTPARSNDTKLLRPGIDALSLKIPPVTEPLPPGTEPPPPGVELLSPVFKIPVQYDDDDFGNF